jgi:aspartate kinase
MIERPLVMKFGGTSVADEDALRRLVEHVAAARRTGAAPVVVVSALAGVTNELLRAASMAAEGDTAADAILDGLRRRHLELTSRVGADLRDEVSRAIAEQFDELSAVIRAIVTLRDASPRALDAIAAAGELLSSRIVHAALAAAGVPAAWADPRRLVITNDDYTEAVPLFDDIAEAVPRELGPALAARRVPVTAGYVGATRDGVTTTLGRGGSDYSAAIIGAALHACEIQIWTDVDGMLTADPRIVAAPRVVPLLSFGEASELAYFGAKVLHPSTIVPAVSRNISVRILNSRRAAAPGTLIASGHSYEPIENDAAVDHRGLAALACKRNVTVVDITSTRMLMAYGYLRRVFEVFERHRTAVDVVTTSEVSVSVTIDDDRRLNGIIEGVADFAEIQVERGMAILCAVGDGLSRDPRIAAQMLGALDGFRLRMVSQAASRRNLTVVLRDADVPAAMTRLHDLFFASSGRGRRATEAVGG